MREIETQNEMRLKSIQHLFKYYYFDRNRYQIELEYMRLRKQNKENSKKRNSSGKENYLDDEGGLRVIHPGIVDKQ